MNDPKNATPVEDIDLMEEVTMEDTFEGELFSEEEMSAAEPEEFPAKDRKAGAAKRRNSRKAKRHDKSVEEMLTDTAGKRTESARDGAKPMKKKIKNAGKRTKSLHKTDTT